MYIANLPFKYPLSITAITVTLNSCPNNYKYEIDYQ